MLELAQMLSQMLSYNSNQVRTKLYFILLQVWERCQGTALLDRSLITYSSKEKKSELPKCQDAALLSDGNTSTEQLSQRVSKELSFPYPRNPAY